MGDFLIAVVFIGVFWAVPILLCALSGRAKRRKWYWFGALGVLSWAGLMIANYIPARREDPPVSEDIRLASQCVRLTWRRLSLAYQPTGSINVEVRLAHNALVSDFAAGSEALRIKAIEAGANAVQAVEYFRTKPAFWTLNPQRTVRVRGEAIRLADSDLLGVPCDAEEMGQWMSTDDPARVLVSSLRSRGVGSIAWALINSVIAYNRQLEVAPTPIYVLSVFMLTAGILCLFARRPRMLVLDGVVLLAVGIVNVLGGIAMLGAFQVVWGIEHGFLAYPKAVRTIEEYARRRAEYESQARETVPA